MGLICVGYLIWTRQSSKHIVYIFFFNIPSLKSGRFYDTGIINAERDSLCLCSVAVTES